MHRRETQDFLKVVATPVRPSLTPCDGSRLGAFRRLVSRQDALNRTKHVQGLRGNIRPVPAVFRDDLAMVGNQMISAHPQIDVVVFTQAKRHVEPPGVEKAPAIIHNGPVHTDLVAPQESDVGVRSDISAARYTRHAAATVDKAITAVDKTGLRMADEAF